MQSIVPLPHVHVCNNIMVDRNKNSLFLKFIVIFFFNLCGSGQPRKHFDNENFQVYAPINVSKVSLT